MTGTDAILIPARSRRQAMDWSLVLLSQGLECVVDRLDGGWGLLVETADGERATAAIRQYEIENRAARQLTWPGAGFDFAVSLWCLALAGFHWLSAADPAFKSAGLLDSVAVGNGAWWLIFSAMTLHGDLAHLMANLTAGFAILGLAMARYGPGCALLAAFLAGAGGNIAGLWLRAEAYHGLGSSGMVMGGLGLLTVQSLALWHANPGGRVWRIIIGGLLAGVLLFTLWGLNPESDVIAHAGGFACGILLGIPMSMLPQRVLYRVTVNVMTIAALVGLVIGSWTMAWRHGWSPM